MATFSISLPEHDMNVIDEEARKQRRSRTAQVQIIIQEWMRGQKHDPEERPQ